MGAILLASGLLIFGEEDRGAKSLATVAAASPTPS
jgi:hypothetical protein